MNEKMTRLYLAASELKNISGQSELAFFLNVSPQLIYNWEARGISSQGILESSRVIGCNPFWVETGEGNMTGLNTHVSSNIDVPSIRRENLKKWFSSRTIPEKEKSYISQLINGKASFGEKAARRLEKNYEMGVGYLDLKEMDLVGCGLHVTSTQIMQTGVPVISLSDALNWKGSESLNNEHERLSTNIPLSKSAFALVVECNSMQPEFQINDVLVFDPEIDPCSGDFVLAAIDNHNAVFRKYRSNGINDSVQNHIELIALNPDYLVLKSNNYSIKIIGVLIEHRRYFKK